jgi:hypothetical protein
MPKYEFTIVASGLDPQADDFEQTFIDAGCDDATVSYQQGHIIVDFAREANAAEEAIASAVEAVSATGAHVDRVEPDPLVSLSDIAARANLSRAAVSQYARGRRRGGGFPSPVARVTSDSPLWDWADVSVWLYRAQQLSRDDALMALVVTSANRIVAGGPDDFRARLAGAVRDEARAL